MFDAAPGHAGRGFLLSADRMNGRIADSIRVSRPDFACRNTSGSYEPFAALMAKREICPLWIDPLCQESRSEVFGSSLVCISTPEYPNRDVIATHSYLSELSATAWLDMIDDNAVFLLRGRVFETRRRCNPRCKLLFTHLHLHLKFASEHPAPYSDGYTARGNRVARYSSPFTNGGFGIDQLLGSHRKPSNCADGCNQ